MSFVERISNYLARWVASKIPNTKYPTKEDQIEVLAYGWMLPIGALYKGILLIFFTIILGILTNNMLYSIITVLFVVLTFSSLRVLSAGGYHMKTYNGCIIISFTQFIGFSLMILLTYQYWYIQYILYLFIFCIIFALYNIKKYIPRDTPNNQIADPLQIPKLKRWSLKYLLIWALLMTIFIFYNLKIIILSSCLGLLLELFSVTDFGYNKFYPKIDTILTKLSNIFH